MRPQPHLTPALSPPKGAEREFLCLSPLLTSPPKGAERELQNISLSSPWGGEGRVRRGIAEIKNRNLSRTAAGMTGCRCGDAS
jgi:hypothetical protein